MKVLKLRLNYSSSMCTEYNMTFCNEIYSHLIRYETKSYKIIVSYPVGRFRKYIISLFTCAYAHIYYNWDIDDRGIVADKNVIILIAIISNLRECHEVRAVGRSSVGQPPPPQKSSQPCEFNTSSHYEWTGGANECCEKRKNGKNEK